MVQLEYITKIYSVIYEDEEFSVKIQGNTQVIDDFEIYFKGSRLTNGQLKNKVREYFYDNLKAE